MMFGRKKLYSSVLTAGLVLAGIGSAGAIETQARNAILMDYDTGQYLYVKDHEKMVPPASMSKLMTVNMIFEKLKDGSLSLDDTFTVSERAWKLGGAAQRRFNDVFENRRKGSGRGHSERHFDSIRQ